MEFLDVPIFDDDIYKLVVRFAINLVFLYLVVGISYWLHQQNHRQVFNLLVMNVVVFFICFTLKKLDLGLGMALGLFAIFAIIRYRTAAIDVKDMTYLFVVIGLAVINALSGKQTSYLELLLTNTVIFGATYFLERRMAEPRKVKAPKLASYEVVYDNIDLLHPGREDELIAELKLRTGIKAVRVNVKQVDLQKSNALIVLKYRGAGNGVA
ncbi:MAG: DUF4956 domain-containing protein [Mariniblastus sp.]|nr:DUF4956 domain-containing protein [Mariniblastus sp.]